MRTTDLEQPEVAATVAEALRGGCHTYFVGPRGGPSARASFTFKVLVAVSSLSSGDQKSGTVRRGGGRAAGVTETLGD